MMDGRGSPRFKVKRQMPDGRIACVLVKPGTPVSYAVVCDAPIDEASASIPMLNVAIVMSTSFSGDRKTFYFTWRIPFCGVIWVSVSSKTDDIRICTISPI